MKFDKWIIPTSISLSETIHYQTVLISTFRHLHTFPRVQKNCMVLTLIGKLLIAPPLTIPNKIKWPLDYIYKKNLSLTNRFTFKAKVIKILD